MEYHSFLSKMITLFRCLQKRNIVCIFYWLTFSSCSLLFAISCLSLHPDWSWPWPRAPLYSWHWLFAFQWYIHNINSREGSSSVIHNRGSYLDFLFYRWRSLKEDKRGEKDRMRKRMKDWWRSQYMYMKS